MKEELAKGFLEEALDDLEAAEILYRNGKWSKVVFLCQQALEKAMKAVLFLIGYGIVMDHKVSAIFGYEMGKRGVEAGDIVTIATSLEEEFPKTRYPRIYRGELFLPSKEFSEEDAKYYLEETKKAISKIEEIFIKLSKSV